MQPLVEAALFTAVPATLGAAATLIGVLPRRAAHDQRELDREKTAKELMANQASACHGIQIEVRRARRRAEEITRHLGEGTPTPEGQEPLKIYQLTDQHVFLLEPGFDLVRAALRDGEQLFDTFTRRYQRAVLQQQGRRALRDLDIILDQIADFEQRLEDVKRAAIFLFLQTVDHTQARHQRMRRRLRRRRAGMSAIFP